MRRILPLITLFVLFSSAVYVYATGEENNVTIQSTEEVKNSQESAQKNTSSNKYFDLELIQMPQSAFGMYVPYVLHITPHLDSPKTQIIWNVPTTVSVNPRHKEFLPMINGQEYTVKANIKPKKFGSYDFSVSVISWQHNTNYTNAASDSITFDKNLVLQPTSPEYQIGSIIKYLLILLSFIILVFLVIFVSKRYSKRVKNWLTPPY